MSKSKHQAQQKGATLNIQEDLLKLNKQKAQIQSEL